MGNSESTDRAKAENDLAYNTFRNDFLHFLSSSLSHHSESRQFLTIREVIRKFSRDFPCHTKWVMSDDEYWHGITMRRTVSLIEKEFGTCVMVYAYLPYPSIPYNNNSEYGKKFARYYEKAIMLGFSWKEQSNLIDL